MQLLYVVDQASVAVDSGLLGFLILPQLFLAVVYFFIDHFVDFGDVGGSLLSLLNAFAELLAKSARYLNFARVQEFDISFVEDFKSDSIHWPHLALLTPFGWLDVRRLSWL